MGQAISNFLEGLEALDQMDKGSGGYIGKINLATGYKVFIAGLANEDSFFPFQVGNEQSQADALAATKAKLAEVGAGVKTKPQVSVQITIFKDHVLGAHAEKAATWKGDRVFVTPKWTEGYTQIIKPALVELVKAGKPLTWGDMWARVTFAKDPTGRQKEDQNGEMKDELVAYVVDVFANEAEAEKAASGTERVGTRQVVDAFAAVKGDPDFAKALKDAIAGKPKPKINGALLNVAEEWEIPNPDTHIAELRALAGVS